MAKLFGIFNSKIPSKDLTKDEAEYKGIKGFFTILKSKGWKMAQMNLVYMLFCIPLFIIFYIGSQFIIPGGTAPIALSPVEHPFVASWNGINVGTSLMLSYSQFWTDLVIRIGFFVLFVSVPILALGPLQAGFSHNIMSFVRGNPVFLMSNFFDKAKTNFKQSMIVSFLDLIIITILAFDLRIYLTSFVGGKGGFIVAIAAIILGIAALIYFIMHMYIYPLMVTFKMTLKQLYKNSFYLAMLSFLPSLGILILNLLVIYIPFILFKNPILHILVSFLLLPALLSLINTYSIYPYINKYLLEPALKEQEKNTN